MKALLVVLLASSAAAAPPTFDQVLSVRTVSRPRIAPDGRLVVYEERHTDWKKNAYVTHLVLADTNGGRRVALTQGKETSDSAEWSPDGRWIAFLSERAASAAPPESKDEKSDDAKPDDKQIWLISPSGGEAWTLTVHGAAIDSFRWSPDGKRIAFAAPVPESKARKDRKEKYSDYAVYQADYEQNQLWVVDVAAAESEQTPQRAQALTSDSKRNVDAFVWSPDGKRIAFSAEPDPLIAHGGESDIYLLDVASKAVKPIVALPGPDGDPRFSPDGTQLAFSTALGEPYFYYTNGHIAVVSLDAAQPAKKAADVRDLTASFDEDTELLDWLPNGIYFRALQRTDSHLFRIDAQSGAIARVSEPAQAMLNEISLTRDGRAAAWSSADGKHIAEVYTSPLESFAPRKLTDASAQIASWTLGSVELVQWKSSDGADVEGVLHKPANYDPSKKYPLLVVIHGGPTGVSRPVTSAISRTYPIEQFLAKGALVLEPNYRGSAGYGSRFRALNVRNLGVGDMWDVMSGVDALVKRGIVDESKLAAMGWSQGGYISAFLTTNTTRFKAISVGAGISDWSTYYVGTDITPFTPQYLHATPWDDPQVYAMTSPITNIKNAKTPTLIQHGEKDKRVPIPNAYELYRGLRDQNVPATLIVYAGFGHGITKPKSNRAALQHNYDWFAHYIWGEEIPKDSPLRGTGE